MLPSTRGVGRAAQTHRPFRRLSAAREGASPAEPFTQP